MSQPPAIPSAIIGKATLMALADEPANPIVLLDRGVRAWMDGQILCVERIVDGYRECTTASAFLELVTKQPNGDPIMARVAYDRAHGELKFGSETVAVPAFRKGK